MTIPVGGEIGEVCGEILADLGDFDIVLGNAFRRPTPVLCVWDGGGYHRQRTCMLALTRLQAGVYHGGCQ